jgi:hypothetical protein
MKNNLADDDDDVALISMTVPSLSKSPTTEMDRMKQIKENRQRMERNHQRRLKYQQKVVNKQPQHRTLLV